MVSISATARLPNRITDAAHGTCKQMITDTATATNIRVSFCIAVVYTLPSSDDRHNGAPDQMWVWTYIQPLHLEDDVQWNRCLIILKYMSMLF
jgi:hypothetical protein